jgi:hypothetical protein
MQAAGWLIPSGVGWGRKHNHRPARKDSKLSTRDTSLLGLAGWYGYTTIHMKGWRPLKRALTSCTTPPLCLADTATLGVPPPSAPSP